CASIAGPVRKSAAGSKTARREQRRSSEEEHATERVDGRTGEKEGQEDGEDTEQEATRQRLPLRSISCHKTYCPGLCSCAPNSKRTSSDSKSLGSTTRPWLPAWRGGRRRKRKALAPL
ncbi:unnamed protein product, partial [Prorocentrum cordatum]